MGKSNDNQVPPWGWTAMAAIATALGIWVITSTSRNNNDEVVTEIPIAEAAPAKPGGGSNAAKEPERLRVKVVRDFPHARDAFTQGLLWHEGRLIESTGQYGHSSLRFVGPDGRVQKKKTLNPTVFAEGIAAVGDDLFQLTWRERKVFVWDIHTFAPGREMSYKGEGWGLCFNGTSLVMSDGSATLTFRQPETFEVKRRVSVKRNGAPVPWLNELECVGEAVYANVWRRDEIVKIDSTTGHVTAVVDASGLLSPEEARGADVLNGIAYASHSDTFFLTGKNWPKMFETRFVPLVEN